VINRALIIAAGRGIRLNSHSQEIPKSLISVGARSILETILSTLQRAGIAEVIIVTGYKHEVIEQRLGDGNRLGLRLRYVFNEDWQKRNGVSVYAARHAFNPPEHFLLAMSDHLFAPEMLTRLMSAPLGEGEVALAVDANIDAIFDIDDATKVLYEGAAIKQIDKTLAVYNGIDCGLFKCTTALFDALAAAMVDGDCSLTEGCRQLIVSNRMKAIEIGEGFWIDIDTPEALAYAMRKLRLPDREVYDGKH
jgi:choline kinase